MKKIKILLTIFMVTAFVQTGQSKTYYYAMNQIPVFVWQEQSKWCFFACMEIMGYIGRGEQCMAASMYAGLSTGKMGFNCCAPNAASQLIVCMQGVHTSLSQRLLNIFYPRYFSRNELEYHFPYAGNVDIDDPGLACIIEDGQNNHAYVADWIEADEYGGYLIMGVDPTPGTPYAYYEYSWAGNLYVFV
jgi:hypothetical protein